jgi:hypothetical protein
VVKVAVRLNSQQRELVNRLVREGWLDAKSAADLIAQAVQAYLEVHPEGPDNGRRDA